MGVLSEGPGRSDLSRDRGWAPLTDAGFGPVSQVAVDETWSALRYRRAPAGGDYVAALFAGPRAHLRPTYDAAVAAIGALGSDVTMHPRKTYVGASRKQQFAVLAPATRDRLDLGLRLPGILVTERLQAPGNIGSSSSTHRVALATPSDVDAQVVAWLRAAYHAAG